MKLRKIEEGIYEFFCPGCKTEHSIWVKGSTYKTNWGWNESMDKPTFTPSLLIRWGKHADPNWVPPDESEDWNMICHSFIKDGMIQFLGDCTHELKNQTVEIPDFKEEL